MPTPTYDLIASNVLSSNASSVTFSSISASYRDVVLVMDVQSTGTGNFPRFRMNSDSGNNYSYVAMSGSGSGTSSNSATSTYLNLGQLDAYPTNTSRYLAILQFNDYSATDKHKSILIRENNAATGVTAIAGRWASTSAINAIEVSLNTNQFASGSTFYLYGIVS